MATGSRYSKCAKTLDLRSLRLRKQCGQLSIDQDNFLHGIIEFQSTLQKFLLLDPMRSPPALHLDIAPEPSYLESVKWRNTVADLFPACLDQRLLVLRMHLEQGTPTLEIIAPSWTYSIFLDCRLAFFGMLCSWKFDYSIERRNSWAKTGK